MKQYIIIENGGTKADWHLKQSDTTLAFVTNSLHSEEVEAEIALFKSKFSSDGEVYIFSSGCLNQAKADELKHKMQPLLGENIIVRSDLDAAGLASLGDKSGWVIIAGTGSVLFEWSGKDVIQLKGGEGPAIGDEGSAFYLGKLIIENIELEKLGSIINKRPNEIRALMQDPIKNKKEIASLALLCKDLPELKNLHRLNIQAFADKHFTTEMLISVAIVGSYGFHNQQVFRDVLRGKGVKSLEFIERPMIKLIERMDAFVD